MTLRKYKTSDNAVNKLLSILEDENKLSGTDAYGNNKHDIKSIVNFWNNVDDPEVGWSSENLLYNIPAGEDDNGEPLIKNEDIANVLYGIWLKNKGLLTDKLREQYNLNDDDYGFDDLFEDALKDQGESQNQPDDKYDLGQLTNGTFVETEHTDDLKAAKEIAKDHLEEDPQYYSKGDFPEEAEEAKDKIVSDENCKDKACSDGNKKDMPGDFKSRVLSDRRMKLIRGFAESFGGAK